jgi:hypothetical protein
MKNILLKSNEGKLDRASRIVVGAVILSLAFTGPHSPWGYLGLIPLVTGLTGICPLYALVGISTCPTDK